MRVKVSRLMFDNLTSIFFYFTIYNCLIPYYNIHGRNIHFIKSVCISYFDYKQTCDIYIYIYLFLLSYCKEWQLCTNFTYMWKGNVLNKSNNVTCCSTFFFLSFLFITKWILISVTFKFRLSLLGKFGHKFILSYFSTSM